MEVSDFSEHKVNDFLEHYASQFYNPAKAHDYYEKHKDLKGRSTAVLTDKGKETWAYTKNSISEKKKADLEAAQKKQEAIIKSSQEKATATLASIAAKLKTFRKTLSEQTTSKIAAVPPISSGLTGEDRVKAMAKRKQQIESIRNESTNTTTAQENSANSERESTRTALKSVLTGIRSSYKSTRGKLTTDYEATYQKEYTSILKENTKAKKGKSGKSGSSEKKTSHPLSYYMTKK